MELRHLRYFVAVAEAGSLTVAAEQKLRTSQPSLSRQIRNLEDEVGAQLLRRSARGIELTPAGRTFLDHARVVLSQVEAAGEAARRVAHPAKPCFAMGFLTGHELTWMPEALQILRDELPNVDVMISSQYSPLLANALLKGTVDAAFLRRERGVPDLAFRLLVKEPLVVILPSNHRLAALKAISPRDLVGEAFVTVSDTVTKISPARSCGPINPSAARRWSRGKTTINGSFARRRNANSGIPRSRRRTAASIVPFTRPLARSGEY